MQLKTNFSFKSHAFSILVDIEMLAMEHSNLEQSVVDLLEQVVHRKLENFKIQVHEGNKKGEGFLSEMIFVSLKNKETGEDHNLVIKSIPSSESGTTREFIYASFFNETQYYIKIFPQLMKFQETYLEIRTFDNYGKCYVTSLDGGHEKIVMDNLKFKGYEVPPKTESLSLKAYEKLFQMYAEFHALSYAFKHHQPQDFLKITKNLENNWLKLLDLPMFKDYINHFMRKVKHYLKEEQENKILEKFEPYVDNCLAIFREKVTYNGQYGTILHGDCWSNNLMIKYNSSKEIEHIKMIDFQLGFVASPALDLIYSFYSGAGKESLDNLEYLLKLYYNTFSETLTKYCCNPEKIYPYKILQKDWKELCHFGLFTGIMLWITKLATDLTDMPTINEFIDGTYDAENSEDFGIKFDEIEFRKHTLDLVRHLYENDFL